MGIWGYCVWGNHTDHVECQRQIPWSICEPSLDLYSLFSSSAIAITDTTTNQTFLIKSSWTQALFVHAIPAVVIAVTSFISRCNDISYAYVLLVSPFTIVLGALSFGNYIVLFSHVKDEMKRRTQSDLGAKMRIPTGKTFTF